MSFISGLHCDKCDKIQIWTAHAPGIKKPKGTYLPGKSTLIEWGRDLGWSIGKEILCPDCREKYGKPMTLKQLQKAHQYKYKGKTVYDVNDFIKLLDSGTIFIGDGILHDGYREIKDIQITVSNAKSIIESDTSRRYKYVIWN